MLGEEKFMQEPIDLKQAFAVEQDLITLDAQEPPIFQPPQRFSEALDQLDPELLAEVSAADVAQLELQNEFTNQAFVGIGRQSAPDGPFAGSHPGNVGFKIVMILVMSAPNVAEGSDAEGEQVRPGPKP